MYVGKLIFSQAMAHLPMESDSYCPNLFQF